MEPANDHCQQWNEVSNRTGWGIFSGKILPVRKKIYYNCIYFQEDTSFGDSCTEKELTLGLLDVLIEENQPTGPQMELGKEKFHVSRVTKTFAWCISSSSQKKPTYS